jgi:hypothetical protein
LPLFSSGVRIRITLMRTRIQLFTLMRTRIYRLHFEPPGFRCEHSPLCGEPLMLLNFEFNADPDPASKTNPDPDMQPWFYGCLSFA